MIQARKLKGFCDYGPEEAKRREKIVSSLRKNASFAGFEEIATPCLEYAEVLLGSGGAESDKEVYRFQDHGERDVALRFDLTVPFARYVAENQGTLALPFRKFQVGDVWRGEKPQKGRYRQFCQADVDIIGSDHFAADVEIVQLIAATLNECLSVPATMHLGNRIILSNLIRSVLGKDVAENKILVAIDKLDKIGVEKVSGIIEKDCGIAPDQSKVLLDLLSGEDLDAIEAKTQGVEDEWVRFKATISALEDLNQNSRIQIKANLKIARGLGYYTGLVFETTIDSLPGFGSVSSGGRYNELVSRFSKKEFAGVGGSIGVDRLLAAELEMKKDQSAVSRNGVFVAVATEGAFTKAFELASAFRGEGVLCEVSVKSSKLGQQFKYADRKQRSHVVVLGDDEITQGTYTLKNLADGEEIKGLKDFRELFQKI